MDTLYIDHRPLFAVNSKKTNKKKLAFTELLG